MTTTTRTTLRTTMTARHGLFSTATSVLLLCAALLLTKSCGVHAVSGSGSGDLAWSETTTAAEGSGWEVTIITTPQPDDSTVQEEVTTDAVEEVDTTTIAGETPSEGGEETTAATVEDGNSTLNPNEPEAETTVDPNTVEPSTSDPSEQQPTDSPSAEPSTSAPSVEESSSSPSEQQTTGTPSEEPSTASPSVEQSSASPSEQPSTSSPIEGSSPASPSEQPSTSSPIEGSSPASPSEQPSTSSPIEGSSPASPSEQSTTSSPSEEQPTTTPEAEPIGSTIAPTPSAPPAFICETPGVFAHNSGDCQRFHKCVQNAPLGELTEYDLECPPLMAFSPTYGRCLRDVSACENDAFVCSAPGRIAGIDSSYYYNCVASLRGGYHKYIVRCSPGQSFDALVGRCWRYDWTVYQPGQAYESEDLLAIKREQKLLKTEEKLRKKAEKNKEKERLKQQKLEEKLAKKAAKEKAKQEAKANKPVSIESVESPEVASIET